MHDPSGHRRRRTLTRVLVAAALALSSLVAVAPPALAEATIEVEVGFGGYVQPGRPTPLRIEVTSDELFVGDLRISDTSGSPIQRIQPIEIPAGTTREIVVVMETNPWSTPRARVELLDGDDLVASGTANGRNLGDGDLVGVLPVIADRGLPETVPVAADSGEAILQALDPDDLVLGSGMLGPLDIVVATARDLSDLDEVALDNLMAWVGRGGRLMVDEPSGSPVVGIPAGWQPEGGTPAVAGLGEIVLTDGNAAAGNWDLLFEPAPTRSRQEDETLAEVVGFWGGEPLSWGLGTDAGFNLPSLTWLMAILGGYVLLTGPVLWFVLKRAHRPGLAWVGVPLLSLLFTASIWILGAGVRDSTEVAHGTIIEVSPRGTTVSSYSLLHSKGGGVERLGLPAGWHVSSSLNEGIPIEFTVADGDPGVDVSVDLDAGGFAVVGGSGTLTEFDDALTVTAESPESGRVVGTVTNNLAIDLHEVVVFADQAGINIGTVAAGASVDYDLAGRVANPMNGQPIEWTVWKDSIDPRFGGFGGPPAEFEPGAVNLGLWNELLARGSINDRPIGTVVAVGWTDELVSPLDPEVDAGRTLVLARSGIDPMGDTLTDLSVPRSFVRGQSSLGAEFRATNIWGGAAMVRYVIPDVAAARDLVLSVPSAQQRVDVWADGEWRQIDIGPNQRVVLELPAEAVVDQRVYLRVLLSFERGLKLRDLAVRTATESEEVEQLAWVPEGVQPGDAATTEGAAG